MAQVMNTDESTRRDWEELIERTLNADKSRGAQYILLKSAQLVGLALCIFVKKELVESITNVEARVCKVRGASLPLGLNGQLD